MSETQFFVQPAESRVGRIALVTIDNGEDYAKPSTFGRAAFESLARALERLEGEEWAGLVLTGKPFVFAAGADIREFPKTTTAELARAGGRAGHEGFARIAALPYPTLAAVNGAALGGGVEIALHCDFRTISSGVRHFACPECFLGIIPGWGGTQLVPRLVGAKTAVTFIVENAMRQNRMLTGEQAFEAGFADRLLAPVEFLDESLAFLIDQIETGATAREPADLADAAEVVRKARLRLDDAVHGAAPAPYRALDLVEGAATWSLEEGYRAEEDALDLDIVGAGPQEQRREQDLDVDLELVHVLQPTLDVAHLADIERQMFVEIDAAVKHPAVDQPILRPAAARRDQVGPQFVVFDIGPGLVALNHMSVGVDGGHGQPPEPILGESLALRRKIVLAAPEGQPEMVV